MTLAGESKDQPKRSHTQEHRNHPRVPKQRRRDPSEQGVEKEQIGNVMEWKVAVWQQPMLSQQPPSDDELVLIVAQREPHGHGIADRRSAEHQQARDHR